MEPTFTTEIGRMRTQEAIARAEHYRLAKMARKTEDPQGHVVRERRRSFLSWRRLLGVATAVIASLVVLAGPASAVQIYDEGGVPGTYVEYQAPATTPPIEAPTDPTLFIVLATMFAIAAVLALFVAWSERRVPKFS